ncbi:MULTISPECIES: hypothetical protein [unclassified Janthinobacterium]|uniref:hypothetical protein n=1 Tax=unclassified Janthinobacterium TaxID=2610881 RepID=UPI001E3823CA|nr:MULTISPECIES: hypothetical protein [unclassified Janthinobacterium]MCC7642381.1 hypothetical protein [Janthinobacterium sp. EB271-G4-3-1]MCC7692408.1 hypothetical protein [Janthinobacterium sp. EB271-G4-3-2]
MAFFSRGYEVFLLLAAPGAPPLWEATQWTPFAASLDDLMARARGKAGVRNHQYNPKGKPISFGRLGWDAKSHAKWTHTPETTEVRFMSLEAWAPTWTVCEKDDQAPDVFLALANESLLGRAGKSLQFGQRLVCAIATDMGSAAAATLRQSLTQLAAQQDAVVFAHTQRQWGRAAYGGFTGAIQDMLIGGLFQPDDPHARPLDDTAFQDVWSKLDIHHA